MNIVFYSGGAGSYVAAKRVVEECEEVILLFTDTKIEDEDLYRFLEQSQKKLGVPLVTIADGRDPWQVYKDTRYIGNTRGARCSIDLKRKVARQYIDDNYPEATLHFGIDLMEQHRAEGIQKVWEGYKCSFPLFQEPYLNKNTILEALQEDGLELPRLYKMGFSHNNCGGFCVKAGQGHFANLLKEKPEYYLECEQKEIQVYEHIGAVRPFLRQTVNGELQYVTLRQFRESIEAGGQVDLFDIGGCGCFAE